MNMAELFDVLIEDYKFNERKSLFKTTQLMDFLKKRLGKEEAEAQTTQSLQRFARQLRDEGRRPGTVNLYLRLITRSYVLAHEAGLIYDRPRIKYFKPPPPKQGCLHPQDVVDIIRGLKINCHKDIVEMLWLSTWRISEVLGIEWKDVDREAGWITIQDSKNGEPRRLPITESVEKILDRREKERCWSQWTRHGRTIRYKNEPTTYIFQRRGKPVSRFYLLKLIQTEAEKLKIDFRPTLHDFRRSAITWMVVKLNVNPSTVKKLSGHRSNKIFQNYVISNQEEVRSAMHLMEDELSGRDLGRFRYSEA